MKVSDEQEARIEEMALARGDALPQPDIGRVRELHGAPGDYLRELELRFRDLDLSGRRILLDCANGATYRVAPEIFRRLGAQAEAPGGHPGRAQHQRRRGVHARRRPGRACGQREATISALPSTATATACWRWTERAPWWTATSCWRSRRSTCARSGRLPGGGVAVTVMTNYGFHTAMRDAGVEVAVTPWATGTCWPSWCAATGRSGASSRATSSTRASSPPGDGLASALLTLEALGDGDLADRHAMEKLPQQLVNVRVRDRGALEGATAVHEAIAAESEGLEGRGRVLVRPSGTEPLVRVMVEAPDEGECTEITHRLVQVVERELGT